MDNFRRGPNTKMGLRFEYEGDVTIGDYTIIDSGVIIRGKIAIGENVKIEPYIKITGEGYVGDGSHIAHNIHNPQIGKNCIMKGEVTDSVLGDGCEIGENAQVTRCNFGVGVKMKHFSGARDADVGDYTNFSEGSTISNYDGVEKKKTKIGGYVMIGVHARIMGGVEIGNEVFVADGARVDKNLPPRTYFNPEKALKYPQLGAFHDNCSWYLYGNYLVLDKSVGPKYRSEFINEMIKKFGGNVEEIKKWLITPIQKVGGRTPIQCIKEEGCRALDDLFLNTKKVREETKKAEAVSKLKEAVKNYVDDAGRWINTEIPTGPLYHKTPKEVVEMLGEKIIPLMVSFAKTKTIH